ncbi:Hsp70 family protein [Paraliomyxa miuraensis]|uniref:Hsp70 family protein n=1 Tax=Paraliomyxa miuraensis TaxID=376150 RepID=UPI00225094AF|nr:Hsp70 family protein [Paraliomyxa miuraensis]MCX4247748.1 Hsp70 family protein [Paraliomyxa miuraensis]
MKYAVGIDLGTTNCALSYAGVDGDGDDRNDAPPVPLPIPQVVAPGEVAERTLMPSFLYCPADSQFPPGSLALSWYPNARDVVGVLARSQGASTPGRLVSSAKSWLSHAGVDRRGEILPWEAPEGVPKLSPLQATARYLGHLRAAWEHAHPEAPLDEQDVVLCVPASFDPVARELTLEAAELAGFDEPPRLLEEPQAALYAWVARRGAAWRKEVSVGDVILVVDIGGGTTDFSLIAVREEEGVLQLERVAVGDHILLGGDNMDLALAYTVRARMEAEGKELDDWQVRALTHGCRAAKETLLGEGAPEVAPLVIPGRGSKLIGGTIRTELTRAELDAVLLEGFFPEVGVDARPQTPRRMGLTTLGLPYPADAAITRHLAAFLARSATTRTTGGDERSFVHPTAILFNGGVTRSPMIRERISAIVTRWATGEGGVGPKVLEGIDAELAVSHGAAYYARARREGGVRIRGGTVQAYYVGIERSELAVPGIPPRVDAVCVAPFGMEEGSEVSLPQAFGLVVGEPVSFRFFGSSSRREDTVGTTTTPAQLAELAPIETALEGLRTPKASEHEQAASGAIAEEIVQVRLHARVTEVGTLELSAVEDAPAGRETPGRRWKLSFDVRGQG